MEKYPPWLDRQAAAAAGSSSSSSGLSAEELERYKAQYDCITRLVAAYESEPDNTAKIMELLQEVRAKAAAAAADVGTVGAVSLILLGVCTVDYLRQHARATGPIVSQLLHDVSCVSHNSSKSCHQHVSAAGTAGLTTGHEKKAVWANGCIQVGHSTPSLPSRACSPCFNIYALCRPAVCRCKPVGSRQQTSCRR
jgi:hypothetical protein